METKNPFPISKHNFESPFGTRTCYWTPRDTRNNVKWTPKDTRKNVKMFGALADPNSFNVIQKHFFKSQESSLNTLFREFDLGIIYFTYI